MKTVLVLNHYQKACGVQSFGLRVWKLIQNSNKVNYIYREVEDSNTFFKYLKEINPDTILFNWHRGTMSWLSDDILNNLWYVEKYFMFHDEVTKRIYDKYLFFGDYDFSRGTKFGDKKALLPRPLLKYDGNYPKNDITTIGSFGFGFWNKGYHTLARLVNDTFDKAIINLHMPYSFFGDPLKRQTNEVEAECRRLVTNPNIKLNITHDLLDDDGVLKFLAGNDINVFLYGENGEGISSVLDYALSIKRPIGISNSRMFRHINNKDIIVGENSIQDIINKGTDLLEKYYENWNPDNFQTEMDKVINAS